MSVGLIRRSTRIKRLDPLLTIGTGPQWAVEAHLPFQLHWSLEYWQRAVRHRSSSGSRGANLGRSMSTSPLTSPPPG